MTWRLEGAPAPPDWTFDWSTFVGRFPLLAALDGCPQDPIHHAEGDVGHHTRLVCRSLAADPAWRALDETDRGVLFAAAMLHDIAKPATTRADGDRITSPGHAARGARLARRLLYEDPTPPPLAIRERIVGLVRHHGLPLWSLDKPSPTRSVLAASEIARPDRLALLATADIDGRTCADAGEMLARIDLFRDLAAEVGCLTGPRAFPSDHSRFAYHRGASDDPDRLVHDDTRSEVLVVCGLPAAGKDHWIARQAADLPAISLDAIRLEMGVDPADEQGPVVSAARQRARLLLRDGAPFVWNSTNVTRTMRRRLIGFLTDYRARVRLVYLEAPRTEIDRRNAARSSPVPGKVIDRLVARLEVPDPTEAHRVEWHAT